MEIWIGIGSIIIALIIAVTPVLWRKYYLRPELTIEIIKNGGSSVSKGLSQRNKPNEEGYIDAWTAIQVFELTWRFKIKIINNSELTAFYPEITVKPNGPSIRLIDKINRLQPLKSTESVELNVEYRKYEETTGAQRTKLGRDLPTEFHDLELLLSYQNSHKSEFYTLFYYAELKNKFLKRKPKEYKTT